MKATTATISTTDQFSKSLLQHAFQAEQNQVKKVCFMVNSEQFKENWTNWNHKAIHAMSPKRLNVSYKLAFKVLHIEYPFCRRFLPVKFFPAVIGVTLSTESHMNLICIGCILYCIL